MVSKLSVSQLIYLSDIFSRILPTVFPNGDDLKKIVEKGEAAKWNAEVASTGGLESLRDKIKLKYFDNSLTGILRKVFSAIINFFRKYDLYIETGIFWPGDSCHYADQVIAKIGRYKQAFTKIALAASKEVLGERLDLSLEELDSKGLSDLKKIYHKKISQLHPDKNPLDPSAAIKFKEVNQVWGDFNELVRVGGTLHPSTDEKIEKEILSPPSTPAKAAKKQFHGTPMKLLMAQAPVSAAN